MKRTIALGTILAALSTGCSEESNMFVDPEFPSIDAAVAHIHPVQDLENHSTSYTGTTEGVLNDGRSVPADSAYLIVNNALLKKFFNQRSIHGELTREHSIPGTNNITLRVYAGEHTATDSTTYNMN